MINNLQISSEMYDVKKPKLDKETSTNIVGLASLDKPWKKYYDEDIMNMSLPSGSMYDYILNNSEDYLDKVALNYFDNKITYEELFDNIEQTANALVKCGVKKNDIVTVIMPTTPESIYLLYALNKIGAIGNFIDPRTSKEGLEHYINEANSSFIFVLDSISEKLRDINTVSNTMINVSPTESMSPRALIEQIQKMWIKEKNALESKLTCTTKLSCSVKALKNVVNNLKDSKKTYGYTNLMQWKDFFEKGQEEVIPSKFKYKSLYSDENAPAVIVHTGGTTGMPKGVVLTNHSINSAAFDCWAAGYDFQSNQNWLNIMPLFIAYGCGNGLHLPLACKMEVIVIPAFDSKEFPDLLDKYKPNHMVGVPEHYGNIVQSELLKNSDLSYIIAPTVGGDAMNLSLEKSTNEFLQSHNCDYKIVKGYGMTEVCAAVCACTSNETNELGSVGIPFPHSTISIFDEETGEELPYGLTNGEPNVGEICINTPNMMLEYYKNEKETNHVLRKHKDGKIWVHSGDLGYMNENGELFIIGRSKDMIIRHDGFKLYPNLIENIILKEPFVKECRVVGFRDTNYIQGQLPAAFIVLQDDCDDLNEALERIKFLCETELQEYSQPAMIKFIDKLPVTNIGKVDLKALKDIADKENCKKIKLLKE